LHRPIGEFAGGDELRDEFAAWEQVTIGADAPERTRE
jgi:hypothetical protein